MLDNKGVDSTRYIEPPLSTISLLLIRISPIIRKRFGCHTQRLVSEDVASEVSLTCSGAWGTRNLTIHADTLIERDQKRSAICPLSSVLPDHDAPGQLGSVDRRVRSEVSECQTQVRRTRSLRAAEAHYD
jgi:hypothetical protein